MNRGYVGCGIPYTLYQQFFGGAATGPALPGREGINADLPYAFNGFTTASGVQVVSANCLTSHAGAINNQLVRCFFVDRATDKPCQEFICGFPSQCALPGHGCCVKSTSSIPSRCQWHDKPADS